MSSPGDDDALSWEGDDDPTLTTGGSRRAPGGSPALPSGYRAVGKGSETVGAASSESDVAAADSAVGLGNAALVAMGVLGGVYLLYAIGWLVGAQRLVGRAPYLLGDVMFQGSAWLAAATPLMWFAAVLLFTRGQNTWVRFVWLVGGVILLVPWPFAMVGTVG